MPLPLRQLEAFHAVVATGSVTKAAEYLKISQPAVSRLIAKLEESLGFPMFHRKGRTLRPTREARFIYGEVERALNNLEHLSLLTQHIQDRKAGHLRLACLPGFATSLLPRVLANFLVTRPGITLTLEPDRPEHIADWILGQQYDLGITESFGGHPAIEKEDILIRTVCVLPAGHPLAGKAVVTPSDLSGVPLIHGKRDHLFYRSLRSAFDAAGAEFKTWVETRQFGVGCIMVAEGHGATVVSEIDAREYAGRDIVVKPFAPALPQHLSLIYPAHTPRSLVTLEFVEVFKKCLEPFQL